MPVFEHGKTAENINMMGRTNGFKKEININ